jgi:hypothetical protein
MIRQAGDVRTGIAMYNTGASALASHRSGRDPDETTTDHDYSRDVIERAELLRPLLVSPNSSAFTWGLLAAALIL